MCIYFPFPYLSLPYCQLYTLRFLIHCFFLIFFRLLCVGNYFLRCHYLAFPLLLPPSFLTHYFQLFCFIFPFHWYLESSSRTSSLSHLASLPFLFFFNLFFLFVFLFFLVPASSVYLVPLYSLFSSCFLPHFFFPFIFLYTPLLSLSSLPFLN